MIKAKQYSRLKDRLALFLLSSLIWISSLPRIAAAVQPRIVTIYNFVRDSDYRIPDSKAVLLNATARQIQLLKETHLPATFALQYDALMDTNYQKLFKEQLPGNCEIGAWWEIPEGLAKRAGLVWRGHHEWDPEANVGFSPGYTPEERLELVDAYMADFKSVFGYYPKTVGSWYIDEVTLAYMARKYGIVASCNCKDQIGTDFYTLWGGYWNQAYYPSRLNAYMPAQTLAGQIDVPIFRMLGSDPIYQHGTTPGLISMEPVYKQGGGGMPEWVDWFMDNLIQEPSLAFGYTQAGQENSFGWNAMKNGLTFQVKLFEKLAATGQIQVETLERAGKWFHKHFPLTPPTSVVALDDWKHEGNKTVWYDSRFYRLNVLWQKNTFFIRDLHCFDQNVLSPTHDTALTATSLAYETLPVIDWAFWRATSPQAGMWPVLLSSDGAILPMVPKGSPIVKEASPKDLSIQQPLASGGMFTIICSEDKVTCTGVDSNGEPLQWAWSLVGGEQQKRIVQKVASNDISYSYAGTDYQLLLPPDSGSCRQLSNGNIRLSPNKSGSLVMVLGTTASTMANTMSPAK